MLIGLVIWIMGDPLVVIVYSLEAILFTGALRNRK